MTHFPPLFMMLMVYGGIAIVLGLTRRVRLRTPWASIIAISAIALLRTFMKLEEGKHVEPELLRMMAVIHGLLLVSALPVLDDVRERLSVGPLRNSLFEIE